MTYTDKECPVCGNKMLLYTKRQIKSYDYPQGGTMRIDTIRSVTYSYWKCPQCRKTITL